MQIPVLDRSFLKHVTVCRLHSLYDLIAFLSSLDQQLQADKKNKSAGNAVQQQTDQDRNTTPKPEATGSAEIPNSSSTGPGPPGANISTSGGNATPKIYGTKPSVIIIDSISALISPVLGANDKRYSNQGYVLMTGVSRLLKQLAATHGVAILMSNHVTESRADAADEISGSTVSNAPRDYVPALGDLWRGQPHMRIQLHVIKDPQGPRVATLTMCPVMVSALCISEPIGNLLLIFPDYQRSHDPLQQQLQRQDQRSSHKTCPVLVGRHRDCLLQDHAFRLRAEHASGVKSAARWFFKIVSHQLDMSICVHD